MKNKICKITEMNEDDTFKLLISSLKEKITQWDYFVNWRKELSNIKLIEYELNLLNSLIGKSDVVSEAKKLILKYPDVIKAIPVLIAIREKSVEVLVDSKNFIYENFNFKAEKPTHREAEKIAIFIDKSGIGELLRDKNIKNLMDYATGVEVGLDSNARKNRTGFLMESIVENFVADICNKTGFQYISQSSEKKMSSEWGIAVNMDN